MTQRGEGDVGRYASTGGWTIGQKPVTELYASAQLIARAVTVAGCKKESSTSHTSTYGVTIKEVAGGIAT